MKKIFILLTVAVVGLSCREVPDLNELTYIPVVVTNHDTTIDFRNYHTYVLPAKVGFITDDKDDTILDPAASSAILDVIESNMDSRGFTKVLTSASADLGFKALVISVTNVAVIYSGYWYGYYDPYYYYGYYPYYPYATTYEYQTGSLIIELSDLANPDTIHNRLNIPWFNMSAGVISETTPVNTTAAVNAVNQAFLQSPYLKTN